DQRPNNGEQQPQHRLDSVLRRGLELGHEQRPIRSQERPHANAGTSAPEKTRSMTSSIAGSSSVRSSTSSPRSCTIAAVRSGASARETRNVVRFSSRSTTSPYEPTSA